MSALARTHRKADPGFALILSMLALTLLTFLGLTLAASTTTELQVATNYRWSQQALYNAEAGVDIARQALERIEWKDAVLPPRLSRDEMRWAARGGVPTNVYGSRPGPNGEPSRDFELAECDKAIDQGQGYIGRGIVLDSPSFEAPFQNVSSFAGQALNGTFTVWVRRPLVWSDSEKTWVDSTDDGTIVLTAEGRAPFAGPAATSSFGSAHGAARYLQVTMTRGASGCDPPIDEVEPAGVPASCGAASPPAGP